MIITTREHFSRWFLWKTERNLNALEEIESSFDSSALSPLSIERSRIINEGNTLFNETRHSKGVKEETKGKECSSSPRNIIDSCEYRRYDGKREKEKREVAEASENRFLRNTKEDAQTHKSISRPSWDR